MSEPRTVWVTGAASGMGASHARRFGALGDRVACWDRDADGVEAVAAEICSTGGEALPLKCDLRNWEEVAAAADLAEDSLGPPRSSSPTPGSFSAASRSKTWIRVNGAASST